MPKRLAPAAAVLAALLAGSTGYCAITYGDPPVTTAPAPPPAPARLLPEAVEPFPLDDTG